jgi:type VI secretion system lysozyme-like protein
LRWLPWSRPLFAAMIILLTKIALIAMVKTAKMIKMIKTIRTIRSLKMRLRLLERVRNASSGLTSIDTNTSETLIASLEKYISMILNSHQGSSVSAPDFGMPDFVSLTGQTDLDTIRELTKTITEVIKKYEPRLKNPVVTHTVSSQETGILEFSLSGVIELHNEMRSLFFSTAINPNGHITVYK